MSEANRKARRDTALAILDLAASIERMTQGFSSLAESFRHAARDLDPNIIDLKFKDPDPPRLPAPGPVKKN